MHTPSQKMTKGCGKRRFTVVPQWINDTKMDMVYHSRIMKFHFNTVFKFMLKSYNFLFPLLLSTKLVMNFSSVAWVLGIAPMKIPKFFQAV